MLPDRVSNPGPLTYESGALPIALRGPANKSCFNVSKCTKYWTNGNEQTVTTDHAAKKEQFDQIYCLPPCNKMNVFAFLF